ncbi:MAG: S9 family peptidase [Candidatus Acidiferrales bacterium]
MNRSISVAAVLFVAAFVNCTARAATGKDARPQSSSAASPAHSPAVDRAIRNMFGVREISEAVISPDGRRVAWVESLTAKNGAPSSNSAIYVADWKSASAPERITATQGGAVAAETDIAWSPDSKRLAFFSDAAHVGQSQLYVCMPDPGCHPSFVLLEFGRGLLQLTHIKGDVSAPLWSPDGKAIAFLFIENAPRAAGPLAAETQPEGVIREASYEQRLALVDLATGHLREISPADMYVYEYDWSPDSTKIVATAAHGNGDNNWWIADLCIFDTVHPAAPQSIFKSTTEIQIGTPKWSPDGQSIAFIGGLMSDEGSVGGDVYALPITGGDARDLTPGMKASASSLQWASDSHSIFFSEIADGQTGIASVNIDSGAVSTLYVAGERVGSGFGPGISLSRDGKIAGVVRQSYSNPPELWAGPIGNWKQVTHINSALHPAWGKAETLHWNTDIGQVQGWLLYPLHYDPEKKYGLIVSVHGGPAAANLQGWPTRWSYVDAMSADDFFVLFPNPRGSYGSGEAFTRANVKDFGGGDFRDIMAGVDAALAAVPVDPNRVGVTGWSYGGYMSMWAVTQTNRFKAAVIGAGLADWLSYYGENDIDQWMIPYFGATVYDDPAVYAKSGPIQFVKNVQTPSLLVVGDSDGECPTPQSFEFWHALMNYHVPTELVVYPHEGHRFANPAHSRDVIDRAVAWFNKYLQ